MIQIQTILKIADNSGVKSAKTIKILKKGQNTRYGKIGDVIVISVKKLHKKNRLVSKLKKGAVCFAVIVKVSAITKRNFGLNFKFSSNSIVLLNKQLKPIANRIIGILPNELRNEKFAKLFSLSSGFI